MLAAYFYLFTWTQQRAIRQYRRIATERPERLLDTPMKSLVAGIIRRDQLTKTVSKELAFAGRGSPLLLVGDTGSGKTTFVLDLTRYLAEQGGVPVPVALRGKSPPLTLRSLAREEFLRQIDPLVRSEGDGQRIWRRLTMDGLVVVLADGLDEVMPGAPNYERDRITRPALMAARSDRLPVLVTSRRQAVPLHAGVPLFELGPLDESQTMQYLESRVRLAEADRKLLAAILNVAEITENPFYLSVLASLGRIGKLDATDLDQGRDRLRVSLLDSWLEALATRALLPDIEISQRQRERIIEGLETTAYMMTVHCDTETDTSALQQMRAEPAALPALASPDIGMVLEGAAHLDLIQAFSVGKDTRFRMRHSIMQAYLASRFIRTRHELWRSLIHDAEFPEADAALVMWSAYMKDRTLAREVCSALMDRANQLEDDTSLSLLVTAAEVANVVAFEHLRDCLEPGADEAWERARPQARLAAVRRLRGWNHDWNFQTLLERTRDPNYGVRWAAAQAIVEGGESAFSSLRSHIASTVEYGRSTPPGNWGGGGHDIAVLGWILPAIRSRLPSEAKAEVQGYVADLARLVPGMPLGTEASLAQGFKLDAQLAGDPGISNGAIGLFHRAKFWYSRVILLHAICIGCIRDPSGNRAGSALLNVTARNNEEHPFVQEAARLCLRAVHDDDWRPYVWGDEGVTITQAGSALADETNVLLADLVLLLNLTEQGSPQEREARKEGTYERKDLPYCIRRSRERTELSAGCNPQCKFKLCPYPDSELPLARGEFSEAFALHRIEMLPRRPLPIPFRPHPGVGRWTRAHRASLLDWWERMAARVGQ